MPADLVRVKVNDFRAEKENSDQFTQAIKGQILSALSPEKIAGDRSFYNIAVADMMSTLSSVSLVKQ